MKIIQGEWEGFSRRVIPKNAPAIQTTEMRMSFYAGVAAVLRIQLAIGDMSVSEEAGVAILEGVHDECRQFADALVNTAEADRRE